MSESAFIVAVPEAEERVRSLRQRFDPSAKLGTPAHITLLYPFMSPELVDDTVLSSAAKLFAEAPTFSFTLTSVERFPDAIYLAPQPSVNFVRLINMLTEIFPEFPPYGGRFKETIPHLTVAHGLEPELNAVQHELSEAMSANGPIRSVCGSVVLIENSTGLWRALHTFRLAGSASRD
jgi:2'-5' RNA ligase